MLLNESAVRNAIIAQAGGCIAQRHALREGVAAASAVGCAVDATVARPLTRVVYIGPVSSINFS